MNTFTNTLVGEAYAFAKLKHKGQKYSDHPFIYHPIQVAKIIKLLCPNDHDLIAAAYLHDTIEDSGVSYHDLLSNFNEDVARLVTEVTKSEYNTFPNLITPRGILLKFADRTANLSNISTWDLERQQKYLLKSKFWQ